MVDKELHSKMAKEWSLELEVMKTGAKGLYHSLRKRCSGSISRYSQPESQPLSLITPEPPPRGKRALLCGVTYRRQKCELKGASQDVKNMRDLLVEQFGFPIDSILVLAEEEPYKHPTRKNIEEAFQWLMRGIQDGDSLVFYFSGHGQRQRDLLGDEIDGFDETICPVDYQSNGMIFDNYINKTIVRPLIRGVKLHAVIDSCHSGTVLDLPHVYNIHTGKWEDNTPPSGAYKGTSGGTAIFFGACKDNQLAADTSAFSPDKGMTGAMTSAFVRAIKEAVVKKQKLTYRRILDTMHESLKQAHKTERLTTKIHRCFHPKILQDPLLSSSEEFSTSTEFKL